jgi:hypothetical protein
MLFQAPLGSPKPQNTENIHHAQQKHPLILTTFCRPFDEAAMSGLALRNSILF